MIENERDQDHVMRRIGEQHALWEAEMILSFFLGAHEPERDAVDEAADVLAAAWARAAGESDAR